MTAINYTRAAIFAMIVGLVLTVTTTAVPFVGSPAGSLISAHVETGYPWYTAEEVGTATNMYLVWLTATGVLGIAVWVLSIAVAHAGKRWAPWIASSAFVLGAGLGLFDLTIHDTSGDTGLPLLIGWLEMLPALAGLVAVVLLWKSQRAQSLTVHATS